MFVVDEQVVRVFLALLRAQAGHWEAPEILVADVINVEFVALLANEVLSLAASAFQNLVVVVKP